MITWSQFHPYILSEVPSAPLPVVDHYIRNAAIEFCEETAVHTIDAAAVDVVAGTSTYALDAGDVELDVCMVKFAWLNGQRLPYISQETLNGDLMTYWPDHESDMPTGFTQQDQGNLILYPKPKLSYPTGLKLKLVVRPSWESTGVYDWVGRRFIQEISFGALAALTGMVGKPWSSQEAESKYRAAFESAKTKATIDAYRSFTRSSLQLSKSASW
jgi:hypothetical protein